jgi:hypothetical protein
MSVDFAGLPAGTTLAGTEIVAVETASATVKQTAADFATLSLSTLAAAAAVTPALTGDLVPVFRSGAAKTVTIDVLTSYVSAGLLWSGLTAGNAVVTGDLLAADRSGLKKITVDALATFVISVIQGETGAAPVTTNTFPFFAGTTPKVATIDQITTFVSTVFLAAEKTGAVSSLQTTDYLLSVAANGTTGQSVTLANLETQLLADLYQSTLNKVASLTAAGALSTADKYLVNQSGTSVVTTLSAIETKVYADFLTYTTGLTDAATVGATDKFYCIAAGTTAKYTTGLEIATYALANAWSVGTATTPALTGDKLLAYRSGTGTISLTVDVLATYCQTGLAAAASNISGLSAITTVGSTDLLLVCQTTTGKKITMANFETQVYGDFLAYLGGLGAVTTVAGTELLYCIQTSAKKLTPAILAAYFWTNTDTSTGASVGTGTVQQLQGLAAKTTPIAADSVLLFDSTTGTPGNPVLSTFGSLRLAAVSVASCAATASTYTTLSNTANWIEIQGVTGNPTYGWKIGHAGTAGEKIVLIETAGYAGLLFPFAGATINGLADTTGSITITAHHVYVCRCLAPNTWFVNDAGALPKS